MQQYTRVAVMALEVMASEQLIRRPAPAPQPGEERLPALVRAAKASRGCRLASHHLAHACWHAGAAGSGGGRAPPEVDFLGRPGPSTSAPAPGPARPPPPQPPPGAIMMEGAEVGGGRRRAVLPTCAHRAYRGCQGVPFPLGCVDAPGSVPFCPLDPTQAVFGRGAISGFSSPWDDEEEEEGGAAGAGSGAAGGEEADRQPLRPVGYTSTFVQGAWVPRPCISARLDRA